jgi:hypothetical protein
MFERFTDRARQSLSLAHDEATALQHGFLGTEHLLLGLLAEGTGIAAVVLTDLGMTLEGTRDAVREMIGPVPDYSATGKPPFTPRAKKVLELALREALELHHNYIGTEHILLGLAREGQGVGAMVIQKAVGDASALELLRGKVTEILDASFPKPPERDSLSALSPAEELRLGQTLVEGRNADLDSDRRRAADGARIVLVNAYKRMVLETIGRNPDRWTNWTNAEALQRGNEALDAAMDSWDPDRNPSFGEHARPLIEEAVAQARTKAAAKLLKCSFCGKSQKQVKKLIAGPGVYICNECIDLCNDIITEELASEAGADEPASPVSEVPPPDPEHPRCRRCRGELTGHTSIHTLGVGDDDIRVLTCDACGEVIGTVP